MKLAQISWIASPELTMFSISVLIKVTGADSLIEVVLNAMVFLYTSDASPPRYMVKS